MVFSTGQTRVCMGGDSALDRSQCSDFLPEACEEGLGYFLTLCPQSPKAETGLEQEWVALGSFASVHEPKHAFESR